MIFPDVNVLLYTHNIESTHHEKVNGWVRAYLEGNEPILLSWPVLWGFVRIATNTRSYQTPISPDRACSFVRFWLTLPQTSVLTPGPKHLEILNFMIVQGQASGSRVSDAVLAAIAMEHGATLVSTDRDFTRFRGLRLINPLDD